jgi:hypothetical protein
MNRRRLHSYKKDLELQARAISHTATNVPQPADATGSPMIKPQDGMEVDGEETSQALVVAGVPYKSWRKKYRKMRLKFDDVMDETNKLFKAEHKAWNTARRLQEELDQILELLVDINDDPKTPANLKWDLRLPEDPESLHLANEPEPGAKSLTELYQSTSHTQHNLIASMASTIDPSTILPPDLLDLAEGQTFTALQPPAFMTTDHETQYLQRLDSELASNIAPMYDLPPGVEAVAPPAPRSRFIVKLTDRDFALRCPVSVHSWLKRNQPQVFESTAVDGKGSRQKLLGPPDGDSEIDAPGSAHGGRSRKSLGAKAAANMKKEQDGTEEALYDEVGGEAGALVKNGRRGNEEPYKPKAPRTSTAPKRKRTGGDAEGGGSVTKKPRKSGVAGDGAAGVVGSEIP